MKKVRRRNEEEMGIRKEKTEEKEKDKELRTEEV